LEKAEEQPLFEALSRLKLQEPIQYIIGQTQFMDLAINVRPGVLIPRPETEELVHWILNDCNEAKKDLTILDLCTGSGCIAIALKKHLPNAWISALDIAGEALDIARENAELNNVQLDFIQQDIFKMDAKRFKDLDIIVSNPPYVRQMEKEYMGNNVLVYEPEQALFVSNEDPLVFYREIAIFAKDVLTPGGYLYFEINQYLANAVEEMLQSHNFGKITLRKDLYGNDRMIKAKLK
jgi:release factor glutamine methyltransferase